MRRIDEIELLNISSDWLRGHAEVGGSQLSHFLGVHASRIRLSELLLHGGFLPQRGQLAHPLGCILVPESICWRATEALTRACLS
jgi:hypothetical protein